jgi:hypothetical protein
MITVRRAAGATLLAAVALAAAAAGTAQATGTPNLVVTSIKPGKFTVQNIGDGRAGSFQIRIQSPTAFEYVARYIQVNGMNAGASATYSLIANYCGGVAPVRDVDLDDDHWVPESNEDDNHADVPLKEKCAGGS